MNDGNPALRTLNQKDQDFQIDTTALHASWEGFHDPHSSLIGYWCKIGTCRGCDDVLSEQYIGLQTGTFLETKLKGLSDLQNPSEIKKNTYQSQHVPFFCQKGRMNLTEKRLFIRFHPVGPEHYSLHGKISLDFRRKFRVFL